jgi:uncharacterized protein with PQ loop repeat
MSKPKAVLAATLSGILNFLAFSQLLIQVHLTKETDNLSYLWALTIISSQALFVYYGIVNEAPGIYITASIFLTGILYIVYIKLNYGSETKKIDKELMDKDILSH